jgi:hypothetical protein
MTTQGVARLVIVGILAAGCGGAGAAHRAARGHPPVATAVWPTRQSGGNFVYDSASHKFVLYGGLPGGRLCSHRLSHAASEAVRATWLFDGRRWSQVNPPGTSGYPPGGVAAYYPDLESTLLVGEGGGYRPAAEADTWLYENGRWRDLHIPSPPYPSDRTIAYVPEMQRVVLLDRQGDGWSFDGRVWHRDTALDLTIPENEPVGLAYDTGSRSLYAVGESLGGGTSGSRFVTWRFEGDHWQEVRTEHSPPNVGSGFFPAATLVAAPGGSGLLLLGDHPSTTAAVAQEAAANGIDGVTEGPAGFVTWRFDGKEWSRLDATGPGPRQAYSIAADPDSGEVLLFGGETYPNHGVTRRSAPPAFNDLWAFDGTTWTQLAGDQPATFRMCRA